jgi:hypothetical protein
MVAARHGAVGDVPGVFVEQVRPGAMAQISGAREGTVLAAVLGSLGIEGEARQGLSAGRRPDAAG